MACGVRQPVGTLSNANGMQVWCTGGLKPTRPMACTNQFDHVDACGLLVALRCGNAAEATAQISSTFSLSDCAGNLTTTMLVRPTPTTSTRGLCLGDHVADLRQELYNCGLRGNTLFCCACGIVHLDCMCSLGSVWIG